MYTRQQGSKILLQPVRTEKPDGNIEKSEGVALKNGDAAVKTECNAENSADKTEKTEVVDTGDGEKSASSVCSDNEISRATNENENAVSGEFENSDRRKVQYKARRPARRVIDKDDSASKKEIQVEVLPCDEATNAKNEPNGALRVRFGNGSDGVALDEMLVLAVLVLLIMQGSDDILVLALCYVLL